MSALHAVADAARQIEQLSDTPRLDAELLMAHALGISREQLLLNPPAEAPPLFPALIERRLAGEPVAYITGRRGFWTIELEVGPGVLIPRPDSETLLEAAVEHFAGASGPRRILDLGTGPGTLLLAALDQWPDASGIGIDRSEQALGYARRNARRLGMEDRAELRAGDWSLGLEGKFDLILCNPPYVPDGATLGPGVREYEPAEALFAGQDGLDCYRRLAPLLPRLLASGGVAAVEIGFDQAGAAGAIFAGQNLRISVCCDLAGRPRALILTCV